jgi:hypothetical protein
MNERLPRQVVCAAIRNKSTGLIICGPRHHHCFNLLHELGLNIEGTWEQGFVDQWNEFMDRVVALELATACNQVQCKTNPEDELFSEDIY